MNTHELFRHKLNALIEAHPTHTQRSLGEACGRSRSYVSGLLKGRSTPGIDFIVAAAGQLGTTPNELLSVSSGRFDLSGEATESARRTEFEMMAERILKRMWDATNTLVATHGGPSIEGVMAWWRRNNGRLADWEHISEHVDLYGVPSSAGSSLEPATMGNNSLASNILGSSSTDQLRRVIEAMTQEQRDAVTYSYFDARNGARIGDHQLSVNVPELGVIEVSYCKLMLPVEDATGSKYILNYSTPLNGNLAIQ